MAVLVQVCLCSGESPVKVGSGSYAPTPPTGVKEIDEQLARRPRIEAESAGRPLPTNDWWTSLLAEPFPGKMHARPAIVSANGGGVRIWHPTGWSPEGNQMNEGQPLEVLAVDRTPDPNGDLVVADFEHDGWSAGWKIEGKALATGPATAAQQNGKGIIGQRWAISFANGGDGPMGTATSPPFRIARSHIHLLVCGGKDGRARVELLVDGKVVHKAVGRNSRDLEPLVWDVSAHAKKEAQLRIVDETSGGWGWIAVDQVVQSNRSEPGSGGLLSTCSTLRWGDWTVAMRLRADEKRWVDATFGHGLPFVWIEAKDLDLRVPCDPAKLKNVTGGVVTLPITTDQLVLEHDGRHYGIFAPEKTRFQASGNGIDPVFADPAKRFLVVALLPSAADAPLFQRHAYAVPRDSRMTWRLDQAAGEVVTTWTVTAQALRGSSTEVLQGWLPHHWRGTRHQLKLAQPEFASPRGRLRLAPGSSFEIAWPFRGVVPGLPAPVPAGGDATAFDAAKTAAWIADEARDYAGKDAAKRVGDDTYWGAKATLKMVQIWTIAEEMQHPAAAQLRDMVREVMTDWYTWTPGETARYFCRYPPPWSGLVGLKTSFGSGTFTDNHFHYGYHTLAAAMLGRFDPAWLAAYGPMARLVAKQFANWERDDKDFPLLRTFDIWHGHSYAGGMSNANDGNNQESTSEAMQSWAGLFLLGSAMGDKDMAAAGAMGYAIESSAVMEYWFDYHGWKDPAAANHAPAYKAKHTMASVVRDRDIGYWTWFSGRAIHVYGIQFIPTWHWMQYLGTDPAFMGWQVDAMAKRESKSESTDLLKLGDDWGVLACIGALSFGDPRRVTALFGQAAQTKAKLDGRNALIHYWVAHTYQSAGTPVTDHWTDPPTGSVYRQPDGSLSVAAWNPTERPAAFTVRTPGKALGTFEVPGNTLLLRRDLPFLRR